jgi:hypothetical protein
MVLQNFSPTELCEQKLYRSSYPVKPPPIAVNKQWILEAHLIKYKLLVIALLLSTGQANMLIGQPILFSYSSDL